MFTISSQQILQMLTLDNQKLENLALTFLKKNLSEVVNDYDEPDLVKKVSSGLTVAKKFGLFGLNDLLGFLAIMFTVSPGFYLQPDIHAILSSEALPKHVKMGKIVNDLGDLAWEEAEKMSGEMYWGINEGMIQSV